MLETKTAAFTFVKQGIFYFSRRVPSDLSHHYDTDRISYSLRTRSAVVANTRTTRAAMQLDNHWYHLRVQDVDLSGKHRLRCQGQSVLSQQTPHAGAEQNTVTLAKLGIPRTTFYRWYDRYLQRGASVEHEPASASEQAKRDVLDKAAIRRLFDASRCR